jgi:hypothetical protein
MTIGRIENTRRPPPGRTRHHPSRAFGVMTVTGASGPAPILLVVLSIVDVQMSPNSPPGWCHCGMGPCNCPVGSSFTAGDPITGTCGSNSTLPVGGCTAGDQVYTLGVESSTVTLGSLRLRVEAPPPSSILTAPGGPASFTLTSASGELVAYWGAPQGQMAMTTGWTYLLHWSSNATPMTNLYSILVDVGSSDLMGRGFVFIASVSGGYPETTSPLGLP